MIAEASESDNKEAGHSFVNCVGLFKADGWKDNYFCKSTCVADCKHHKRNCGSRFNSYTQDYVKLNQVTLGGW